MMKNMGLGKKIGLGFACVLILLITGSGVAWYALHTASAGFETYRELARDTNLGGRLQANMLMVRMNVKDFIITGSDQDVQQYNEYLEKMETFLAEAQQRIDHPARAKQIDLVDEDVTDYKAGFKTVVEHMHHRDHLVNEILNVQGPEMERALTQIMTAADQAGDATTAFRAGQALRNLLLARLYVVKFLDDNSPASVERVQQEFEQMNEQLAALDQPDATNSQQSLLNQVNSLKQTYTTAFNDLTQTINSRNDIITNTLDRIGPEVAAAVEDVKLSVKNEQDELGPRLQASNQRAVAIVTTVAGVALVLGVVVSIFLTRSITKPVNRIIANLTEGADQVNDAGAQVSTASQQLAEGASEQASSLEETSSALEQMAAMTRTNAENAKQANELAAKARSAADAGDQTMRKLNEAMTGINDSSDQISKVIKVIEEIAFQTNLLALNAAVEAARAGEHGKGFAVVADEVRNLAQRCAEAARETTGLIEGAATRSREGVTVADEVGQALGAIVGDVAKVTDLINGISRASEEQAQGVDQVNTAVSQMDKVTQQNAAGAEESASAAEELSAQAQAVKATVNDLVILVRGGSHHRTASSAGPAHHMQPKKRRPTPVTAHAATQTSQPQHHAAPHHADHSFDSSDSPEHDSVSNF